MQNCIRMEMTEMPSFLLMCVRSFPPLLSSFLPDKCGDYDEYHSVFLPSFSSCIGRPNDDGRLHLLPPFHIIMVAYYTQRGIH